MIKTQLFALAFKTFLNYIYCVFIVYLTQNSSFISSHFLCFNLVQHFGQLRLFQMCYRNKLDLTVCFPLIAHLKKGFLWFCGFHIRIKGIRTEDVTDLTAAEYGGNLQLLTYKQYWICVTQEVEDRQFDSRLLQSTCWCVLGQDT